YEASSAQSYWRYNTHLGPLLLAVAAQAAGAAAARWPTLTRGSAAITSVAMAVVVILPLAAWPQIRFDLDPAKQADSEVAAMMDLLVPPEARLVVIDAQSDGFHAIHVRYLMGAHRRLLAAINQTDPDTEAFCRRIIDGAAASHVWLRSWTRASLDCLDLGSLDRDRSYLLTRNGKNWRVEQSRGDNPDMNLPTIHCFFLRLIHGHADSCRFTDGRQSQTCGTVRRPGP
ncbi:MAG: hypothetical protein J0626_06860, partial [Rhodospirillaceae bacterium]|nr:hypothetical protein [Rhodospirillaceae bacterium]